MELIARMRSKSNTMKNTYLTSEINSIFNIKNNKFSIYCISFAFTACFFQILDTTYNTWFHNTWYFHSAKISAYEEIGFIQWIQPSILGLKIW